MDWRAVGAPDAGRGPDAENGAREVDTLGGMCKQTRCSKCGRPGWAGCGAHVEQVLGHVPRSERCNCGPHASASAPRGWLRRRPAKNPTA